MTLKHCIQDNNSCAAYKNTDLLAAHILTSVQRMKSDLHASC